MVIARARSRMSAVMYTLDGSASNAKLLELSNCHSLPIAGQIPKILLDRQAGLHVRQRVTRKIGKGVIGGDILPSDHRSENVRYSMPALPADAKQLLQLYSHLAKELPREYEFQAVL